MHTVRNRIDQDGRVGIALERPDADDPVVLDLGQKRAPVRMIEHKLLGHMRALQGVA